MARKKKEEVVDPGPKYLTPEEMHRFETANLKMAMRKEQRRSAELKKQVLAQTIQTLKEQIRVQEGLAKMLEHEAVKLEQVIGEETRAHREWFFGLKVKYGVDKDAGFGHDPISGEIIVS